MSRKKLKRRKFFIIMRINAREDTSIILFCEPDLKEKVERVHDNVDQKVRIILYGNAN